MKHAVAETLRWIGFLTIAAGTVGVVVTTGMAGAPHAVVAFKWLLDQVGLTALLAALIFVGLGIFHIGEWVSPHTPDRSSRTVPHPAALGQAS